MTEASPMRDGLGLAGIRVLNNAPIPTWFGVGGPAEVLASPATAAELQQCLRAHPGAKILGDGANLLVADAGVRGLVIDLSDRNRGELSNWREISGASTDHTVIEAGAAVHIFKLINATAELGLSGLENLAGIPATVGGAIAMNAGGKFGSMADVVLEVDCVHRGTGELRTLAASDCDFGYRHSCFSLGASVIVRARLRLLRHTAEQVKAKYKEVSAYKLSTQPMSASSAGCMFKNPTLVCARAAELGVSITAAAAAAGALRVSAGLLIDRAGCKGLRLGTASVSDQHGNFLTADKQGRADDVHALALEVSRRVAARFGITLEREVVMWGFDSAL